MGMMTVTPLLDGFGGVVSGAETLVDDTRWPRTGEGLERKPLIKKEVTDDDFRLAWYGGEDEESQKSASDNQGILRAIRRKFRTQLDEDESDSCAMVAMWRTLQSHDAAYGQKFTTSLHKFAMWEYLKAVKKKERISESNMEGDVLPLIERHTVDEHDTWAELSGLTDQERQFLSEMIEQLPYSWQRQVIREYYLNEKSHDAIGFINGGVSKETSRLRLDHALAELKYIVQKNEETHVEHVRQCV